MPPRKKIHYGDLDFWNFVPKSIGSSVSENFANFWRFQKIRLKGFLLENLPRKPPWASLARSALEPPWPSLARSVPKPSPPENPDLIANDLHLLKARSEALVVSEVSE